MIDVDSMHASDDSIYAPDFVLTLCVCLLLLLLYMAYRSKIYGAAVK